MAQSDHDSRRRFFTVLSAGAGFAFLASKFSGFAFAQGKAAPPAAGVAKKPGAVETALVDEKSQMAVALKFYHDGNKAPAALKVTKSGVTGAQQICGNCLFYAKTSGEKAAEVGKCQLLPVGLVKVGGWCNTWAKKA